jgi:hypothetical protein
MPGADQIKPNAFLAAHAKALARQVEMTRPLGHRACRWTDEVAGMLFPARGRNVF